MKAGVAGHVWSIEEIVANPIVPPAFHLGRRITCNGPAKPPRSKPMGVAAAERKIVAPAVLRAASQGEGETC